MSPGGTSIEPLKIYSASKTGFQHLNDENMIKIPNEVRAEIDGLRVPGLSIASGI